MTAQIMTRTNPRLVDTAALQDLHDLVGRMVREADTTVLPDRRAWRTLQEMAPGYERQPVLILHRPTMAEDSCPLCGRWNCDPSKCPPSSAVPAPVAADNGLQCDVCGGRFGVASQATAWTCAACQNIGR